MNQQERQLLDSFLDQLVRVGNLPKDPEADQLIARAVARQPDAVYLLVQRALLLEQALEQAKAQIAQLQQQAQSRSAGDSSFLGGGAWGRHPEPAEPASQSVTGRPLPPAGAAPVQQPGM